MFVNYRIHLGWHQKFPSLSSTQIIAPGIDIQKLQRGSTGRAKPFVFENDAGPQFFAGLDCKHVPATTQVHDDQVGQVGQVADTY